MGKTLYIADIHFGHKNCLAYNNRPFRDIEEHDRELIKRWNESVDIDDDVCMDTGRYKLVSCNENS